MKIAPYGTWNSPLIASQVCASSVRFQELRVENNTLFWSEMRPSEGGRSALLKMVQGESPVEILPKEFSVRTRVHEYGGGAFSVKNEIVYFINDEDQRLYKLLPQGEIFPITQAGTRFAECQITQWGIIAIAEIHHDAQNPENFLALINEQSGEVTILHRGEDFYAFPAISMDEQKIAWVSWNHPNMPWDDTKLWRAQLTTSGLKHIQQIETDFSEQSFLQPRWDRHHDLYVISDKSNWWNLYRLRENALQPIFSVEADLAQPLWNLGVSTWDFFQEGILCCYPNPENEGLSVGLFLNNEFKAFSLPYHAFSQIRVATDFFCCIASSSDKPTAIILSNGATFQIVKENGTLPVALDYLSQPQAITYESEAGRIAHAYFYSPRNPDYQAPVDTQPPLIVQSHGGPTANCGKNLNLEIQYWTTRGYAFLDVNYGGSTGFGRAYRNLLKGNWGIIDVQDCVQGALTVCHQGKGDPNRLAIVGGSAGGFTTLSALTFTQVFHVGASLYGVSDCEALALDTHKFESKYLDSLIGPYPQAKAIYQVRSPINHVKQLSSPVIFFQGTEDKVVPPEQTEKMFNALKQKNIETALFLFEGEQHGFRKAENRATVLEEQAVFFRKVLKLESN